MYTDRYREVLDQIPDRIARAKRERKVPVLAFTSNLDIVLHWNAETYSRILDRYLKEEPCLRAGDTMKDMRDFARISAYYVARGKGGNFDIESPDVCSFLRESFTSELSLGGTCAQGAAAIGTVGFPVSVHLTDMCREVLSMLDHEGTTVVRDGKLVPVMEGVSGLPPVAHIILQFSAGDKVRVRGKEVTVPLSNRLILFYDRMQKKVPVSEEFLRFWEKEETDAEPASFLASGFDAIVEEPVMADHAERLETFFGNIRKNHRNTATYFEGAYYMNPSLKTMIFSRLSPFMDMIGMNEEELEAQVERLGRKADLSGPEGVIRALDMVLEACPAGGVILHTKDYAMYYGRERRDFDIESGLTMGNLMSSTRARTGRYGNLQDLRDSLQLQLSERGLAFWEEASKLRTFRQLTIVPSRYLEHPKYTIGLGDTFVAGVHTCFL